MLVVSCFPWYFDSVRNLFPWHLCSLDYRLKYQNNNNNNKLLPRVLGDQCDENTLYGN